MKGFLIAVLLMGGAYYWLEHGGSGGGGEPGFYASATGEVVEVTPENFDFAVTHNEAPVLAYFWAPW